jgi:hypothetical protein
MKNSSFIPNGFESPFHVKLASNRCVCIYSTLHMCGQSQDEMRFTDTDLRYDISVCLALNLHTGVESNPHGYAHH